MEMPMKPIIDELIELRQEIEALKNMRFKEEEMEEEKLYIENLDQIKLYLREELGLFAIKLSNILKQKEK